MYYSIQSNRGRCSSPERTGVRAQSQRQCRAEAEPSRSRAKPCAQTSSASSLREQPWAKLNGDPRVKLSRKP